MCDPCSFRGITTQAVTFCKVCSEYMCDTCEAVHHSSRASRDHELNPFEESQRLSMKQKALITSIMACDIHRTEPITLFCFNHDKAVCNVCNSIKHRKCNTQTVEQISKDANKMEEVAQWPKKLKALLSQITKIKDSRGKDRDLIQGCSRRCIQDVKKIKHQIIDFAESLAKDMEDEIKNTKSQLIAEIENEIKAGVEMTKQIQQIITTFEILGNDIIDAALVFMMKEKGNIKDGMEMKDDLMKQGKPIMLEFQKSKKLLTLMTEITSMGRLQLKDKIYDSVDGRKSQPCFQDITLSTKKNTINAGTKDVTACKFMPDGKLVICDGSNYSVKVFTDDFKLKNELKFGSLVWDLAAVSKDEVIVTEPNSTRLQFLNVSTAIIKGKRISVGLTCCGVECNNGRLYISCHMSDGKGGVVKVLTMDGVTINAFNISQGWPSYLGVNSSGERILISTYSHGVVCIDSTGQTLFVYSDSHLRKSLGLCFDAYVNFMVCGEGTNIIHVVKSDGAEHKSLLNQKDGLNLPRCLAYRPSDDTLVIGQMHSSGSLLAFTLQ